MFYIEVSGTPYEMGRQHGRALKLMIGSMVDYVARSVRKWDDARIEKARQKNMGYTEKRCPELLDELQGIVDGAGFPYKWIYMINCYAALKVQCTNIIFTDTPDGPILGTTNDLPTYEGKHTGICLRRPKGSPRVLTTCLPGCVWQGRAVTETGLVISGSSLNTPLPKPREFMDNHFVGAHIIRRCETVKDAVSLLREIHQGKGASHALLDKSGDAAIVEKSGGKVGVRRPEENRVWCTNIAYSPELRPYRPDNPEVVKESEERFEAIDLLTRDGPLGLDVMKKTLAYNGRPGTICRYGDDDPLKFETESAEIMRPSHGVMEFCSTHPDRDQWQRFSIQAGREQTEA